MFLRVRSPDVLLSLTATGMEQIFKMVNEVGWRCLCLLLNRISRSSKARRGPHAA
jgi:hypothetical protein